MEKQQLIWWGVAAAAATALGFGAMKLIHLVQTATIDGTTVPVDSDKGPGTPVTAPPVITAPPAPAPPPAMASLPAAPTGVTVTGISTSSVRVDWDPVPGATSYQVVHPAYQSTPEQVVATTSDTSATVAGLAWNSPYTVWVVARNAAGAGPRSERASGSTLG